jgi:hypothetical protein
MYLLFIPQYVRLRTSNSLKSLILLITAFHPKEMHLSIKIVVICLPMFMKSFALIDLPLIERVWLARSVSIVSSSL